MPIATNDKGESLFLSDDGQWQPAKTAKNPQTGETVAYDGKAWQSVKASKQDIGVGNIAREFAEGVPIIGGLLNKANAATYAAAAPIFPGDTTVSHAENFGQRYQENLERENKRDTDFEEQHPIAATTAGVVGGVASTLPLAATATGAKMLGLGGQTFGSQVLGGAASGAGINAADALVRGGNPLTAAAVGGVAGAAAEPVARGIGMIAEPIATTVRGIFNPGEEASRRVAGAASRDLAAGTTGLTPQEFVGAKQAGQPVTNLETGGETTRALARSAANTSPEGRAVLDKTINKRFESQGSRLADWTNTTFHFPNAVAQQEAIEETGRTANSSTYKKAYREGEAGIDIGHLASSDAVQAAMKKAASAAKDEATMQGYGAMNPRVSFSPDGRMQFAKGPSGGPLYPDLQFWDLTRRELSASAAQAKRAGNDTEYRRLSFFAKEINKTLDNAVPSYNEARTGAARFFGAENALEAGQAFVTSRMENREARAALAKMSPLEKQLFQDGYVDAFVRQVREGKDRQSIMNTIATSDAARERLSIALGPDKAKELEAMLHVEGVMDLARNAVQGNSTTARQLAELGLAGGAAGISSGYNYLSGGDTSAILNAALVYGAAKGHGVIDARVAEQVARQLSSDDPKFLVAGMKAIAKSQTMLNSLRKFTAALGRAGSTETDRPSLAPQSPMATPSPLAAGAQ